VNGLDQVSLLTVQFNSAEQELLSKPFDSSKAFEVQSELERRVILLFRDIIEYQARAVHYFYHNGGARARVLRDSVKVDDWSGLLEQIHRSKINCSDLVVRIRSDRLESRFGRQVRAGRT
jgi:N-terminal domain of NWD NACHT-NTPase